MLDKLLDRYDEVTYFVAHHENKLLNDNKIALNYAMIAVGFIYLVAVFNVFFFQTNFEGDIRYFVPGVVQVLYYILHKRLEPKISDSVGYMRLYMLFVILAQSLTLCYLDAVINNEKRGVVFIFCILLVTMIYVDHFFLMFGFKIALFFGFFILTMILKRPGFSGDDIRIGGIALLLSIVCDMIILANRADAGTDTRIFEEKSQIDLLTGLYNKLSFEEKSKRYLANRNQGEECSLFILDFDNFKHVNDNYGHLIGDETLKAFGKILQSDFRASDIVGRVGGDEFMVLVTGGMPEGYIKKRCDYVQHELNILRIGEAKGFSCSIGVAVDAKGVDFDTLYRSADDALYRAKENGKARYEENRIGEDK